MTDSEFLAICRGQYRDASREDLIESMAKLRLENTSLTAALLNEAGDNLCWFDPARVAIPPEPEFLESCRRYHLQMAARNGILEGCMTIAQLEADNRKLREQCEYLSEKMERAMIAVAHFTHRYNEDVAALEELKELKRGATVSHDPSTPGAKRKEETY